MLTCYYCDENFTYPVYSENGHDYCSQHCLDYGEFYTIAPERHELEWTQEIPKDDGWYFIGWPDRVECHLICSDNKEQRGWHEFDGEWDRYNWISLDRMLEDRFNKMYMKFYGPIKVPPAY